MQLEPTIDLLNQNSLFQGIDQEQLSLLVFSAERLLFREGETITKAGEPGDAAYLVLSGKAKRLEFGVTKTKESEISRGYLVGELAMLVEFTYGNSVVAVEETEVLELPRELVHKLMKQFPDIAEQFSTRIHARLMRMADDLRRFDRELEAVEQAS